MKVIGTRYSIDKEAGAPALNEAMPAVFLMSDSSLLKDGKPFFVPDFAERFGSTPYVVARVSRLGKNIARRFAHRYYDALTVGIAVNAEAMHGNFCGGVPEALACAFDGAAILGDFVGMEEIAAAGHISATVDGTMLMECDVAALTGCIDSLIEYVSRYFTLKIGDILYACIIGDKTYMTPESVVSATLNGAEILHFKVK
ncbi:MAG: fumarylacetoacetate hydrolase family protein [Muribaculaceae bacterium]